MSDSRFAMVEAQYRSLRAAFDAGRIDAAAFEAALDATAFEHAGRWWMIGADSGRWYASEQGNWVLATPPASATGVPGGATPALPSEGPSPRPGSKLRTALGWALLVSPVLLVLGAWLTQYAADEHWDNSDPGTSLLVAGVLLASLSIVARYRWVRRLPAFIAALAWAGAGFVAIRFELGHSFDIWWWPDALFATGCAAIVGSGIGALLRARVAPPAGPGAQLQ